MFMSQSEFGDLPPGSTPVPPRVGATTTPMAQIGPISVAPSGEGIVVSFLDQAGAPAAVQSLISLDEYQQLRIGQALPGSFALSWGGRTTTPIVATDNPPEFSATYTVSGLTAGAAVNVYGGWNASGVHSKAALVEVFDGPGPATRANRLASASFDQTVAPPATYVTAGGCPYALLNPGGPVTPTGSTILVRWTSPAGLDPQVVLSDANWFATDGVAVRPAAGGAAVQVASASAVLAGNLYYWHTATSGNAPSPVGGQAVLENVSPSVGGDRVAANAGFYWTVAAAAVQAALTAGATPVLAAGNVAVSGPPSGPLSIHFQGTLAGSAQPLLTASDPAVTLVRSNPGGQSPTFTINGGPAIRLPSPVWGVSSLRLPWIYYSLPQGGPTHRYATFNANLSNYVGGWSFAYPSPAGPKIPYGTSTDPAATASATFEGLLPAGTYQPYLTWVPGAGNCPSVSYTVSVRTYVADGTSATTTGAAVLVDQRVAPVGVADGAVTYRAVGPPLVLAGISHRIVIKQANAAGSGTMVSDAVRLTRTSADPTLRIVPGDVVTFSAVAGFATTAAGTVPAAAGIVAANLAGGSLLPAFPDGPRAMQIGWNVEGDSYSQSNIVHANIAARMASPMPYVVTSDANNYPTRIYGPTTQGVMQVSLVDPGGDAAGIPALPQGPYAITWDGTSDVNLDRVNASTILAELTPVGFPVTGRATGNRRLISVTDPYLRSPGIQLIIRGTAPVGDGTADYRCDVRNLRVTPSDAAGTIADPSKPYHASVAARLAGSASLRFIDPLNAVGSNCQALADYPPASVLGDPRGKVTKLALASVGPDPGGDNFFIASDGGVTIVLVTTAVPHGLTSTQDGNYGTIDVRSGPVPIVGGGTVGLANSGSAIRIKSPTSFLMQFFLGGVTLAPTPYTCKPGDFFTYVVGASDGSSGWSSLESCIDFCNQVGSNMWFNLVHGTPDAGVTEILGFIARRLRPGLKVRLEWGNECWNGAYPAHGYSVQFGRVTSPALPLLASNATTPYQVYRSGQVHALARAAFVAAGRPATDVIRVIGTHQTDSSYTASLLAGAVAQGFAFDEMATAGYYNCDANDTGSEPFGPTFDNFTTGQNLDYFQLQLARGWVRAEFQSHTNAIASAAAANPSVPWLAAMKVVTYESGPGAVLPMDRSPSDYGAPGAASADYYARSNAVVRHPRYFGIHREKLRQAEAGGCTLDQDFYNAGGDGNDSRWSANVGYFMPPGTGDLAVDSANVASPANLDVTLVPPVKSQVQGAANFYIARLAPPVAPRPPAALRMFPGRNGPVRASGDPHRLFRRPR